MRLEELVSQKYDSLNETDLYIWQYIYHHKRQCQKMSVLELAQVCNLSHTRILSFTKKLGLEGYSELKFRIKWELNDESTFDPAIIDKSIIEFNDTLQRMKHVDLDACLAKLDQAKRIFIYATGTVQQNVAMELKREFAYRQKVMHVTEGHDELDTLLKYVTEQDFFIVISYSGDHEVATNLMKYLKRMHIPILGICKDGNGYVQQHSDYLLTFQASDFPTGYFDIEYSITGHFFLISNMLFLKYLEYKSNEESET